MFGVLFWLLHHFQTQCEHQQGYVSSYTEARQNHHHIPTRSKASPAQPVLSHRIEELPVGLHPSERTDGQHPSAIYCEQCA